MTEPRGLVALTGGTGFLGEYILSALLSGGWRVRLLARRDLPPRAGVEVVRGDLADKNALTSLVLGADVVVHAAGLVKAARRADFFRVNADGAAAVARAIRHQPRMPRVIVLSSLAARCPELSDYAASKRAGETALAVFPEVLVLRPTAVYGPGDREAARFLDAASHGYLPVPRTHKAKVTLVHASDVASAVVNVCASPLNGIFELTDARAEGYSWPELAREIAAAAGTPVRILQLPAFVFRAIAWLSRASAGCTGKPAMLVPGKVRELFHDWSSDPGRQLPPGVWQARMLLSEGLRETIAWLRVHP